MQKRGLQSAINAPESESDLAELSPLGKAVTLVDFLFQEEVPLGSGRWKFPG